MTTNAYIWYLLVGLLLLLVVMLQSALKRLPVSAAILYLLIGVALGPSGVGLLRIDPLRDSVVLETVAEVALLISLFSVGLKMRLPLRHRDWAIALRLAAGALVFTIALMSPLAMVVLGLPLAAALALAAILSPTDPVLASDVQLRHAGDRDRVRFSLTAEGGVNDGIALPFVILALTLLGVQERQGIAGWVVWDLLWPIPVGVASGWICAYMAGKVTLHLRRQDRDAIGLDEFLALGIMGVAYGLALLVHGNGFLAVFAAGLALRRFEVTGHEEAAARAVPLSEIEAAASPEEPAHLMRSLLNFIEQLEHIVEVGVVLVIGAMLRPAYLTLGALAVAAALFCVARPVSVLVIFADGALPRSQLRLLAWFGIRGVGSLYYLMYAVNHGLPRELAQQLIGIVLPVLAASIIVHGISATPLMERYARSRRRTVRQP
jgi:NhaP-type Na+/H+ or K+/H+ antiporter